MSVWLICIPGNFFLVVLKLVISVLKSPYIPSRHEAEGFLLPGTRLTPKVRKLAGITSNYMANHFLFDTLF